MNIIRIAPAADDSPRTPTLLALFDVETPNATLRDCKLLERAGKTPRFFKLGRVTRISEDAVREWIAAREAESLEEVA